MNYLFDGLTMKRERRGERKREQTEGQERGAERVTRGTKRKIEDG